MVFAEAQAMGTPVVSFRHGGIPEVVLHQETGLLAEERNSDQLASHISRLLQDNALWARLSDRGVAAAAENFDLRGQTAALEELYTETCRSTESASAKTWSANRVSTASNAS